MLDIWTANQWACRTHFLSDIKRWTWFRDAFAPLIQRLAPADVLQHGPSAIDTSALARSFWPWAGTLDSTRLLEPLDPVDYAHFSSGILLGQFVQHRPLQLSGVDRSVEVRVLTDAALTLLAAWRQALGASPLLDELTECPASRWSSYVENVAEDRSQAPAFLDLFTGREPVWRFPTLLEERPAFKRALAARRRATTID